MVFGALIGVPIGTYFLSRLDPVTTRWIISGFVFALLMLLLSGWRYRGKDHAAISIGIGGPVRFLQRARANRRAADRRLLARPPARLGDRARQHPAVLAASDFFSAVSYSLTGLITTPSGSRCWSARSTPSAS